MAAARLDPNQRARAEGLAREIAASIISGQARTPDRKSAQALPGSTSETRASLSSFSFIPGRDAGQ